MWVVYATDYDEPGVSDLAVYDNEQTARQHAERAYGYYEVSRQYISTQLPAYLRRKKGKN